VRPRIVFFATSVAFLASALPGWSASATPPSTALLGQACQEPAGQTDTPPHPRLHRAVVDGVDVAVVLPPGYDQDRRRYPVLYLLHGAQGDEDSWIQYGGLLEDTGARPANQQAIVVMPRMGVITGLAVDWVDGYRRDATLIGRTLVEWVDRTWRTQADRDHRAIAGYSGGGLSAAHIAERFPEVFGQLGVLSGAVDLRNPAGQAAAYAMFETEKMCAGDDVSAAGPLGDPVTHADAWAAADPLHGAATLRDTTVWLSSGNGMPCTPEDAANLVYPTAATEPQIRQQAEAFSAALTAAGVQHINNRRPCGLHWWTRWRPDLNSFWDVASVQWRK
jgi:diacylglycerol O-acyltransferase / trehalose O-mycolyltransferase